MASDTLLSSFYMKENCDSEWLSNLSGDTGNNSQEWTLNANTLVQNLLFTMVHDKTEWVKKVKVGEWRKLY